MRRRHLLGAIMAAGMPLPPARAQWRPDRPVRWIVPFTAGGPTDLVGRLLAERLAARWGQPVVVENRPGAGTVVANTAIARSAPDGLTLGMTISAFTLNPVLRSSLPYDTLRDIAPVTQLAISPVVLAAHRGLAADSLPEMVALARRTEGGLAYGTAGVGTLSHLVMELLARRAGVRLVHVPYPGFAQSLPDLMQGRIAMITDVWGGMRPHVQSGEMKVLGVAGKAPVPGAPGLPRMADTYPEIDVSSSFGLIAAAGTPAPVLERIAADIRAVLHLPEVQARMTEFGMVPVGSTPAEYAAWVRADLERWQRVVREANIRVE